jgi:FkbM family methyltransferase
MEKELAKSNAEVQVIASDPAFDIVKVRTPGRDFWVPRQGAELNGGALIAYLLAEHRWMEKANPDRQVKPGDTVLDCGAHVGIFTESALRRGAAKVIAFEIDPVNLECLRRNLAREIAENRVVVVAKGVWSSETTMDFTVSTHNSGRGSLVIKGFGTTTIPVPLIRIDTALADLQVRRVDFIKMDIEGAEREALAGAAHTLRRFKPTLALDAYHLPDDPTVLPRIILAANPAYSVTCGPCERFADAYKPHVLYYR